MFHFVYLPAIFFVFRYFLSQSVSRLISQNIAQKRNQAIQVVNEIFISTIANVLINVIVFMIAIYGFHNVLTDKQLVLLVSTVYAGTVLHVIFKFLVNSYWIYEMSRYVARHGINGPKAWLRSHVERDIHARFLQMTWLSRMAYRFSGAPNQHQLIETLTHEIWRVVVIKTVAIFVIIGLYIAIFALFTRPILIQEATHS